MRLFARALLRRCPRCGQGQVVSGLRLVEACPRCEHRYERHEGYWLGAIAVNTVATLGLFAVVLIGSMVITWPDPPWTAITTGAVAVNLLFPIAFYPWSKLLWVALDLTLHPLEPAA